MACGISLHHNSLASGFFNCGGMRILQTLQTVGALKELSQKWRTPYIETKVNDHCWVWDMGNIDLKTPFVKVRQLNTASLHEVEWWTYILTVAKRITEANSWGQWVYFEKEFTHDTFIWHDLYSCFFTFIEKGRLEKPRNRHWIWLRKVEINIDRCPVASLMP